MGTLARVRRIGERHDVSGLAVGFDTRGRRRSPVIGRRFPEADVVDVSASGAQLLVGHDPGLVEGQLVTICAKGAIGTARIARISPVRQRGLAIVGITFENLDQALSDYLLKDVFDTGPALPDVVWSR